MSCDSYFEYFEYHLRDRMALRIKKVRTPKKKEVVDEGSQTSPQPAPGSTPEHSQTAEGICCKSGRDYGQQIGGKGVDNLMERRGVDRGPCQEGPSGEKD